MTENDVHMVWVQKQVIMWWFVTFGSFHAKLPKLVSVIFWSCIDVKQQQNDRNYVQNIWVKNIVILGLFSFLTYFCGKGIVLWLQEVFNCINGKQQ